MLGISQGGLPAFVVDIVAGSKNRKPWGDIKFQSGLIMMVSAVLNSARGGSGTLFDRVRTAMSFRLAIAWRVNLQRSPTPLTSRVQSFFLPRIFQERLTVSYPLGSPR